VEDEVENTTVQFMLQTYSKI